MIFRSAKGKGATTNTASKGEEGEVIMNKYYIV